MNYLITSALLILGILYHVFVSVGNLKKKFPAFSFKDIWVTFLKEEWDSLFRSALGVCVFELAVFVVQHYNVGLTQTHWFFVYAFALVWGYAGQRLAYKYLNTAEKVLEQKADNIAKLN